MFEKHKKNRIFLLLGLFTLIIGSIVAERLKPTITLEKYTHIGLIVMLVGFSFIFIWAITAAIKTDEKHETDIKKGLSPIFESKCTHISGLASFAAEGTIKVFVDKLKFSVGGTYYSLPIERIVSAEIMTQKQTEYITTQKLSRAVLGGLVFGDIGALIGGMPKSEVIETTEENLVISYTKDDDVEFIVLKNLPCKKVIRAIEQNVDLKPRHIDL